MTLNLPEKISGKEKQLLPINYTANARHGLDRIEWDATDVIKAGGQVSDLGNLAYHVAFPPYIDGAVNSYVLRGRAVDKKGNYSTSSSTNIYVTGVNIDRVNSIISLTPDNLPANTTSRSILHLTLNTDAGNAVSGVAGHITFAVRDISGHIPRARSLPQPVVISDAQEIQTGVYEASVTSGSLVGRFEIIPSVRGVQLNPIILTQSADAATATIHGSASVTFSTPSITANGTDKNHLEVLVTDALGHPVPGVEVKWGSDLNPSGLAHITSITNEFGIAENIFSSTVTGTANITVQVGTSLPVQAGAIEITADNSAMTVNGSHFIATQTPVVADGTNKAVYKLKVTDKQGNAVPATAVEWLSNIGSFIQGSTTTTDANGETFIELVSSKAEIAKVTAMVGGKPYSATEVMFIANRHTGKIVILPVSKNRAAANGTDSMTLNAKITDANNNPIKNEYVGWDVPNHKVTFDPVTKKTKTNDLGETQITLTSTQVGDITLHAQVMKNDLALNLATEKLSFTADTITANIADWLAPTATKLIADGVKTVSYKVLVKDNNGHVVPNSRVIWQTNLGEFTAAQAVTAISNTDSNGEASIMLSSVKAGLATVTASVNGNKHTSSARVEFTANSSTAKIAIAPNNQSDFVANGSDKVTYEITVVDANNNPVQMEAISWKDENGHPVSIIPMVSQTDNAGKATVNITSLKAGKAQIRATLGNADTAIAQQISFNADRQTAKIKNVAVVGNKHPEPNGSSSLSYITTVEDANGNPVGGVILNWGSNINKVASQTTTTDANGMSTQTLTGTQAGKVEVSVQLISGSHAGKLEKNTAAEFVATTPVMANADLLLQPNLIIANGKQTSTLKFTLRDVNHNPISGLNKQIEITQSPTNHVTIGAVSETAAKGVYQATIFGVTEGPVDLIAKVKGYGVSKMQKLTLQADNQTATLKTVIPSKTTAQANGIDGITYNATVIDANGNASLDNVSVGWRTDLGELLAITKTNKFGVATVTLTSKQAGSARVTAIVSSASSMNASAVTFMPGGISLAQSSAVVSSAELVAGGTTTLVVNIKDANGNPLVGHAGEIKVATASFPGLVLPSQFTEGPDGVYTATITGTKAGAGEIITKLNGSELAKQQLKVVADVSSAKIGEIKPLKSGPLSVGDTVIYQAKLVDANNNLLGANIPVHWSVNGATLIIGSKMMSLTNKAGVAEIEISRDVQGNAVVAAAVGTSRQQAATVNFTSGGVDISASSMQLLQGKITADNVDIATIRVDLRDSKGNPLANLASQITTSPKSGEHGLQITTQAHPSGGYLVNIQGTQAGNHAVKVSVAGKPFSKAIDVKLVGDTVTAKLAAVKVSSTIFKADDVEQVTYTAKVVDAHNNVLAHYPVAWRLAQGEGKYQSLSYTGQTGIAETKLSVSRLGQYKMEAQVRQQVEAAPDVSTTAGDVDPAQSDFVVNVASIDASGKTKAKLTATLKDKFGNLLTGQQVKVTTNNSMKGLTFSADPMKDNGDGTYSTEVTSVIKGNTNFIASINRKKLNQQPQLLVGNIIPQLSFSKSKEAITYSRQARQAQTLKGLHPKLMPHWSSDNSDVAKIDKDTGEIKLLKAGVVTISVLTLPNETYTAGNASYQLIVEKADPGINFAVAKQATTWMDTVSPQNFVLSNSDVTRGELSTMWQSADNNIATVDSKGQVALVKPGTTKIKIISLENERFKHSEANYELNIAKYKQPISFAHAVLSNKDSDSRNVQQPKERLAVNAHLETKWSSSDSRIVRVANDGSTMNLAGPGKARITLRVVGNDWYEEQSGSYQQEVYVKPKVSISSTRATSNHVSKDNERVWSPVFTDDNLQVSMTTASSIYERANSVTAILLDGTQELARKDITISSSSAIDFNPKPDWAGRSLKVKVVAKNGYGQENEVTLAHEIRVGTLEPIDIWKSAIFTRNYSLHNSDGSKRGSCPTVNNLFYPNYARLNWRMQLKLNKDMLHPMQITSLESKSSRDGLTMSHISSATKEISDSYDKTDDNRLINKCIKDEYGTYSTYMTIKYVGREYKYKAANGFYWEGGGDGKYVDESDGFNKAP